MTTPESPKKPETPPATPKRKRRRWLKITLIILAVLFLLILLAPTLASTSIGKNMILSQVNSRMPGKISMDSLSLGWFSGAKVTKFEFKDGKGKSVISADKIDTSVTVLDVLFGSTVDLEKVA